MINGSIEKIVSESFLNPKYENNIFMELNADIILSQNKIVSIYLGRLINEIEKMREESQGHLVDIYKESKDSVLTNGERLIKIKAESLHEPITNSWIEDGFNLLSQIEKEAYIGWEIFYEFPKPYAEKAIKEHNKKHQHLTSASFPSPPKIEGDLASLKKFVQKHGKKLSFDNTKLVSPVYKSPKAIIRKYSLNLECIGTNIDAVRYMSLVDKFLRTR